MIIHTILWLIIGIIIRSERKVIYNGVGEGM